MSTHLPAHPPPPADCVLLACLWEATARKPGNVHPEASFADLTFADFVESARRVAPILARTRELGVGRAIREAVQATQGVAPNPNLGIILLLAPLAACDPAVKLKQGIGPVLAGLTVADAEEAYTAIRLARPGGIGRAAEQDVAERPTVTLREAMALAADRDLVAAQYATNYELVLGAGFDAFAKSAAAGEPWEQAILRLQLELLAGRPDSLIARKCGQEVAEEASRRARDVLAAGWPVSSAGLKAHVEFDAWLRADGHRRNPGTTADLIAAILYAALRDGAVLAETGPVAAVPKSTSLSG